jgi:hypothetical protein
MKHSLSKALGLGILALAVLTWQPVAIAQASPELNAVENRLRLLRMYPVQQAISVSNG